MQIVRVFGINSIEVKKSEVVGTLVGVMTFILSYCGYYNVFVYLI
jgi:hypothetical protein